MFCPHLVPLLRKCHLKPASPGLHFPGKVSLTDRVPLLFTCLRCEVLCFALSLLVDTVTKVHASMRTCKLAFRRMSPPLTVPSVSFFLTIHQSPPPTALFLACDRRLPNSILLSTRDTLEDILASNEMATSTKSGFPQFVDGDVLIVVSTTQCYKLHSQVLCAHSAYFSEQLAIKSPTPLNAQARHENLPASRFEFKRSQDGSFGEFVRVVRENTTAYEHFRIQKNNDFTGDQ